MTKCISQVKSIWPIYFSIDMFDFDPCNNFIVILISVTSLSVTIAYGLEIIFYFGTTESLVGTADVKEI
jgi:hypothetical protein